MPGIRYPSTEASAWAQTGVDKVIAAGISDGSRPRDFATREETMVMLARALGL